MADDLASLMNQGLELAQNGDIAAARILFRRAVAGPGAAHPLVHYNLAKALAEPPQPDLPAALAHYRRAAELAPEFAPAWNGLGAVLLDLDRPEEAAEAYRQRALLRRTPHAGQFDDLNQTTHGKLAHDIEQLDYLAAQRRLPAPLFDAALSYRAAQAVLPQPGPGWPVVDIPAAIGARLSATYNRLAVWEPPAAFDGPAVNPALNGAAIEARYRATGPGIVHVDELLTRAALDGLRQFCLNGMMWNRYRYANGYLGAFIEDGFVAPLLTQVAAELRRALPNLLGPHPLQKLWAFKYDSKVSGIPIHADFAAINVNFWLTPDDANLDPAGGGLDIWDKEAPADWDFSKFNNDVPAIRRFLVESGARRLSIPYRQNRAAIFNSDLFHETAGVNFRPGYENRRINVTMLFGLRGDRQPLAGA